MKKDRRTFIKDISTISLSLGLVPTALAAKDSSKSKKKVPDLIADPKAIRIGVIGCSGRAKTNIKEFKAIGQKLTALCDVDSSSRVTNVLKENGLDHLNVYSDYRKFFEKEHKNLDAVVVSTPDVSHFGISMMAIKYGLPVYVEKPMCHSISQIRMITKEAKERNVVTQMGNQSHSKDGIHICNEWIKAGLIGKVREVSIWTDRPYAGGTSIISTIHKKYKGLSDEIPVPETLNWDAWQSTASVAPLRDYVLPSRWRVWWKYGSGALGDIGCHMLDIPVFALGLGMPSKVVSRQFGGTKHYCAQQEVVEFYFDTTNQGVPLKISWYSGAINKSKAKDFPDFQYDMLPNAPEEYAKTGNSIDRVLGNGMFIVGDSGVLFSPTMHLGGAPTLLPKAKYTDLKEGNKLPEAELRYEGGNHYINFVKAVRGEEIASSNFEYASKLTEIAQLGNLSLRTNSTIEWDAATMTCKNNPEANALVNEELRDTWY